MTTEDKALALVNEVNVERGYAPYSKFDRDFDHTSEALCRAVEQHEAFKQEVSDAAEEYEEAGFPMAWAGFERFIITKPKPDPLVEVMKRLGWYNADTDAADFRVTLGDFGLEIREKGQ